MSTRIQSAPVKTRNVGTRISVVVRVRPPNQREIASAQGNVIHVLDDRVLIFDPPGERVQKTKFTQTSKSRAKNLHFGFDKVLSPDHSQEDVFDVVKNTIFSEEGGLLDGFNCTVFAYGATGSGKTFSMAGTPENPGLMSRAVQYIYTALEGMGRKAKLKLSYLEIYNEHIRDLISSEDNSKELKIVEDPEKGIIVTGLSHCYPTNTDEVLSLISIGNNRRTQAQTESNPVSSRSHAVCQIEVENCEDMPDIESSHAIGKLSLIDLAGSERATSNTGIRLKESANINCSLLALSNCINALCTQSSFIPFRQSKLTRLLKDSLGGNCKTVCLSCVSPSYLTYDDTYSTLQYANKTKNIRTNVSKNTLNVKQQVSQYPKIIAELRAQILQLQSQGGGNQIAEAYARSIDEPFNKEKQSILSLFNREMQNIVGSDVKQQMLALQKMANSDIKRKISLKLSAFTTECIRKKPTQSNRAIENEQKIKMLELENIAFKSQLELYEKQISIQQSVIRSLSQKQPSQQILSQRQFIPQQQQLIFQQQQQQPINTMPLLDTTQPPISVTKSDEIIDLIDLTDEPKVSRSENADPNKNNDTLLSLFDKPGINTIKPYNSNQTKEFYSKSYQYQSQTQNQSQNLLHNQQSLPYQPQNVSVNQSQNLFSDPSPNMLSNQSQNLTSNQSQILPFQRTPLSFSSSQQQSSFSSQQQPASTQQQPLSARRQLENRVSITDMSRIKNIRNNLNNINSSNNNYNTNDSISYNNINTINNSPRYSINSINSNNTNNYNITSCTSNNNYSNSVNYNNNNSDGNNSNQPISKIVRHDDPGRLFRQKFAEAEKMDSARKPLSEKSGNSTVSTGSTKFGTTVYKSLMDKLSERFAAANAIDGSDETTSILLRSRMLTQAGKR